MTLEVATHIADLNELYPEDGSSANEIDDHIRLIKQVLANTFPGDGASDLMDAPLTVTRAQIEGWDARVTALEALPAPAQTSAKIGVVNVTGTGTINVTGLGFEPKAVLAFSTGKTSGWCDFSMACYDRAYQPSDRGHVLAMGNEDSVNWANSSAYATFLGAILGNTGVREAISISDTNSDGFDVFVNIYIAGMYCIYVAIP